MTEPIEPSSVTSSPFLVRTVAVPKDLGQVEEQPVAQAATQPPLEAEERPIEAYERSTGRPYIADILEMSPVYGHSGYEEAVKAVDQYVLGEIAERNLRSTKSSYQQVVLELEGIAGIESNLEYDSKLEKLGALVTVLSEMKKINTLKEKYGLG